MTSSNHRTNRRRFVQGMAAAVRGDMGMHKHPDLVELVLVTPNPLFQRIGRAFQQAQYGSIPTRVFATLDEALAYVRSRVEAGD